MNITDTCILVPVTNMEKILESLVNVDPETSSPNANEIPRSTNNPPHNQTEMAAATQISKVEGTSLSEDKTASSSVEEEIDDVMNVLKDLNDVASGTFATNSSNIVTKATVNSNSVEHNVVDTLTSVQDVSKVVDFSKSCINDSSSHPQISASQAADEMCAKLNARQAELEKRFANISNRVNQMRCRQFGSHVADQLTTLRSFYENATQPNLQGAHSFDTSSIFVADTPRRTNQLPQQHSIQASGLLSGSGGIQMPLHNIPRATGHPVPPDRISLPNTPVQLNPQSSSSQTSAGGIMFPPIGTMKKAPSLPTTPLAPSDLGASTSAFTPRSAAKSSNVGINVTSPFSVEASNQSSVSQTIQSKKIKVEKAKKNKTGKDKQPERISYPQEEQKHSIQSKIISNVESENINDGLNHLEANLRHLIHSYDSEATESSSGGESCDEFDGYLDTSYQHNQRDRESKLYQRLKSQQSCQSSVQSLSKPKVSNVQSPPPIKHRAKWAWLSNRAIIGSKWTWLTAQISDLEYRIRQQNDLVRQIRALKGPVTLGDPVVTSPPGDSNEKHTISEDMEEKEKQNRILKDLYRDYTELFDSNGRKIIIREPIAPSDNAEDTIKKTTNDSSQLSAMLGGSCRTRPLKQLRRRCILPTKGLYRTSARAAKESTVRCECIHPLYSCAICFGRSNHTQAPDPVFQDRARTISLLDHSYHQVLSNSKSDVPLGLLIMQKLKNRSWMTAATIGSKDQDSFASASDNKREDVMTEKERRKEERRLKKLAAKNAAIASGQIEDTKTKNRKKYAAAKKRKLERELELELEEEGLITSEIPAEELKAMLDEKRKRLEARKSAKAGINSNKRRNSEGSNKEARRKRLKMLANSEKIRRKSVTVHHQADGNIHAMTDLAGGHGDELDEIEASSVTSSSLPSPSVHGIHQLPTMEQIRRKRETAFDIDNITIPYSMMASARVEKLKYKEIQTPVWRIVDEDIHCNKTPDEESNKGTENDMKEIVEDDSIIERPLEKDITNKNTNEPPDEESSQLTTDLPLKEFQSPSLIKGILKVVDEDNKLQIEDNSNSSNDQKSLKVEIVPPVTIKPEYQQKSEPPTRDISEPKDKSADSVSTECAIDSENFEDISEILYQDRHAKAEIEEQIRWRTPLWKSSGGQRAVHRSFSTASSTSGRDLREHSNFSITTGAVSIGDANQTKNYSITHSGGLGEKRTSQRQDSRSSTAEKAKCYEAGGSLSSGCNTPDPLSPSMVERVDTLEVNTRPSTPTESTSLTQNEATVAANLAASIRNRRRTSSATKSRDRNPSEDASASANSTAAHSRCTTPIEQQPVNIRGSAHSTGTPGGNWSPAVVSHSTGGLLSGYFAATVEIRPFEPRTFPLSDELYDHMQVEDQKQVPILTITS